MKLLWFLLVGLLAISVCAEEEEEGELFEGDIELTPDQMAAFEEQKAKNSFGSIRSNHWKNNGKNDVIPYYIDPKISGASSAIAAAISDYHKYTCLRFSKKSSRPSGPHIFFTTGTGCSSPVGKRSYGNSIKLASGCWRKGTIMHEIGHSIGFYHEQSRPDRDNYVEIIWSNVKSANKHNFNKYKTDRIDSLGTAYDYDSMMHYGRNFFALDRSKFTIRTKDASKQYTIGQRSGFSPGDIAQIKLMYCTREGGLSSCVDSQSNCTGWKVYCRSNSWVRSNCKKTCGTC